MRSYRVKGTWADTTAFDVMRIDGGRFGAANLNTAVDKILRGKERLFNRKFEQLCGHYLVEQVACTPGAGWEKGQFENQVG